MSDRDDTPATGPAVPGTGGASQESAEGQSALKLHMGIAAVACVLCGFVTGIFAWLGSGLLAVIFGVLTLACVGILFWARNRRHRGRTTA